ncbi:uncharacterized protein SPSK_10350 [Sporothrix schenckii 1099-18]|uniref:Uncharacterized protein n=1 Tax=Sporothrix schenckii 1099-18 TaxID=1397361 RepID=A0A0F2LWB0_SPOSC|nr:uncharacterized protein SPSK_10350 [Sporothrix schenckii 1099-18]KJR81743.1 hypothetical protein SPSK_10350 [Sporothrix schenckii 1099-18]
MSPSDIFGAVIGPARLRITGEFVAGHEYGPRNTTHKKSKPPRQLFFSANDSDHKAGQPPYPSLHADRRSLATSLSSKSAEAAEAEDNKSKQDQTGRSKQCGLRLQQRPVPILRMQPILLPYFGRAVFGCGLAQRGGGQLGRPDP